MVRLAIYLLIGLAVWYGWRALRRQSDRVVKSMKDAEGKMAEKEPLSLEKDPETGIYRPRPRD